MLAELERLGGDGAGVGLHVHVSRAGFDSAAHVYRWMKLLHRNRDQLISLARGDPDHWAAFTDKDRAEIVHYAAGGREGAQRYRAINVLNEHTFELRIFASSLDPREVQAALAFVEATVEYSRQLSVADVVARSGWDWSAFRAWLVGQPEYAPLAREIELERVQPEHRRGVAEAATHVRDAARAAGNSRAAGVVRSVVAFGAAVLLWRPAAAGPRGSRPSAPSMPGWRARLAWPAAPSRARMIGHVAVAAGIVVAVVLCSGPVGVLAAAVAGVITPVLVTLLRHLWARGPPWARPVFTAFVVVAVIVAVLAVAGSSARADPGLPGEQAPGVGSALSDAGGWCC